MKKLTIALLAAMLLAAACGGGSGESSSGGNGGSGSNGEPQHGGTLTVPVPAEPRTLDPGQEPNLFTQTVAMQMFDTLLRINPEKLPDEREIIGSLASDWEMNEDATELRLTLREGVTWHDGEPFTSEDVKVTLERARDMPDGVGSAQAQAILTGAEIETPSDYEVIIRSEEPNPVLPRGLTAPALSVVPAHLVGDDPHAIEKTAIGTGPFKLAEWRTGSGITVERNEDYWDDPYPYLDKIEFPFMPDLNSRTSAFISGQSQLSGQGVIIPAVEWDVLSQQVQGTQLFEHDGPAKFVAFFNTEKEPFDDPRVRQAFALVSDQQVQGNRAYDGHFVTGTYGFSVDSEWALPEDELAEFPTIAGVTDEDKEAARKLLAEAGYPDGLEVDFLVGDVDVYVSLSEVYAAQLEEIGVNAKMRVLPLDTDVTPMLRNGEFQMSMSAATALVADPCITLNVYRTDAVVNFSNYSNPEFDEAHETVCTSADEETRHEAARTAQRILFEETPAAILATPLFIQGARPEVKGLTHPGLLQENLWLTTVWLDD